MTSSLQTSSADDFDFMIGDWEVIHKRLKERLNGCTEWIEFHGRSSTRKILGGTGNIEDNHLSLPGDAYHAVALRSFNKETRSWAIWWLDGRGPHSLDTPVAGGFSDDTGRFFAADELDRRPIRIRFLWLKNVSGKPRWEQAFSADEGATWETNWTMDFTPCKR